MTELNKGQLAEESTSQQNDSISTNQELENLTEDQVEKPLSASDFRSASYFVLTISAIFVINAMETGSYRTPWPVAVVVTLAGLWLFGYSLLREKREKKLG